MRVLCIGEVMAEVSGHAPDFKVSFAGDTFNSAVYCKRLLKKTDHVAYLTRLGSDPLSLACRAFADQHDVSFTNVEPSTKTNIGIYAIQTNERGDRSFAYWRSQSAARELFQSEDDFSPIKDADLVLLSGISLAILTPPAREALLTRLTVFRKEGGKVAFDSNYRPALWEDRETAQSIVSKAWAQCDIALPSVDDEMALFGDEDADQVIARLHRYGCNFGVLKRGDAGPFLLCGTEMPPLPRVETPVDTTSAGDSFNAGFLAGIIRGQSPSEAAKLGHNLASQVVLKRGAIVDTDVSAVAQA